MSSAHYFQINCIYSQLFMDKELHCTVDYIKKSVDLLARLREHSLRDMGGLEVWTINKLFDELNAC